MRPQNGMLLKLSDHNQESKTTGAGAVAHGSARFDSETYTLSVVLGKRKQ